MPYHRFRLGQMVEVPPVVRDALIPPGPYVVVRLLPVDGGEPRYRVKSAADGHERALLEGQMRPVAAEPAPKVEQAPTAKSPRPAPAQRMTVAKRTAAKPSRKKAVRGRR